ncbi:MAG: sulfite exporter TauE/SafE family protein [Clostridia bacterium]|nr:sulfite exporter TauE/SafE family protein [Clostridia bacterium]
MNIAALLAGLFSGIIGAMGMGGGAVLIIYLTLFTTTEQLTAQGINLIFFIPIALLSVIIYSVKKKIKWKTALTIAGFGLIGAVAGIFLSDLLSEKWTGYLFGILLIVMGLKEIFSKTNNTLEKNE